MQHFHLHSSPPSASVDQVSIGSDNGLSPIRRQAIIETNAQLLSIGLLGTNFSEISIKIQNFSFTKMHLKTSYAKWRPFHPGGDELSENEATLQQRTIERMIEALHILVRFVILGFRRYVYKSFSVYSLTLRQ